MAGCAAGLRRSLGARSGGRVRGTMFIAVPLHQLQGSELTLIVQAAARPLRLEQPRERARLAGPVARCARPLDRQLQLLPPQAARAQEVSHR